MPRGAQEAPRGAGEEEEEFLGREGEEGYPTNGESICEGLRGREHMRANEG